MSQEKRPDYLTCIADPDNAKHSYCGEYLFDFHFLDKDHAEKAIEQGCRLLPCPDCLEAIIDKELSGIDETEIESENGWWETSTGAEFGKEKADKIRQAVRMLKAVAEAK